MARLSYFYVNDVCFVVEQHA